jgi:hypothetical protein
MEDPQVTAPPDQLETTTEAPTKSSKIWEEFLARIAACKAYRKKLIPSWTSNIDFRRGKPFASQVDEDRVVVNLDWSLTKAKQATLFSQVPQVHIDHPPQSLGAAWAFPFEQKLNDTLVTAGMESALDECLPDVINAAGIGAVIVSHESITEQVDVPAIDMGTLPPDVHQQILQTGKMPDGSEVPTETVPRIVDHRYTINRISPADLLWPINFTGADFDNAPWIGRSGRIPWAQAVQVFSLNEADKEKIIGGEGRTYLDKLTHDIDKDKVTPDDSVEFDEIFYKEHQFDPKSRSYSTINHMVFVSGKDEPVIDGPWEGQQQGEDGQVVGALRFPIRVLTLTYITDETIPPSDTAMGRPQVNEINKSRTQMIMQRERSLPVRWFDVNRIDPTIQQSLMRGTWQAMIPVQGEGSRSIGEVSRATMPQEDFTFDSIAKNDLTESWQLGPNQAGNFGQGRQSASESNIVQENFNTRIGRERAKVSKFIVTISEVLGGLLALYEPPDSFGQGFDPSVSKLFAYSILADATVLLDSNQKKKKLEEFINFSAKSGWLNIEPIMKEYATLCGLDPNTVVQKPEPKPPAEPNISLRLTGTEDLNQPMSLAMLLKSGQAPDPKLIEQAKQLIILAGQMPLPPAPPQVGPDGQPLPPGPPGPGGPPPPGGGVPPPAPPPVGDANPKWSLMPKVNKRTDQDV